MLALINAQNLQHCPLVDTCDRCLGAADAAETSFFNLLFPSSAELHPSVCLYFYPRGIIFQSSLNKYSKNAKGDPPYPAQQFYILARPVMPSRARESRKYVGFHSNQSLRQLTNLTRLQPERRELIGKMDWCRDRLKGKLALSRPLWHDWGPVHWRAQWQCHTRELNLQPLESKAPILKHCAVCLLYAGCLKPLKTLGLLGPVVFSRQGKCLVFHVVFSRLQACLDFE